MKVSVKHLVVDQYIRSLVALKNVIGKAKTHAQSRKWDENLFLQRSLAPDMFPLVKQVQIATDTAKGTVARLAGKEAPVFQDNETSLEQIWNRIDKTIDYLNKFNEHDFDGFENRKATFPWYPGKHLKGFDYLTSHSIPNFYFHVTTAYNILRNSGVEIGKGDFLGEQNWISE